MALTAEMNSPLYDNLNTHFRCFFSSSSAPFISDRFHLSRFPGKFEIPSPGRSRKRTRSKFRRSFPFFLRSESVRWELERVDGTTRITRIVFPSITNNANGPWFLFLGNRARERGEKMTFFSRFFLSVFYRSDLTSLRESLMALRSEIVCPDPIWYCPSAKER